MPSFQNIKVFSSRKLSDSSDYHFRRGFSTLKRVATGGIIAIFVFSSLAQGYRQGHCEKGTKGFLQHYRSFEMSPAPSSRIPCAFVPHGGGPLPILGDKQHVELVKWLGKFVPKYLTGDKKPTSCLVISAHWEEKQATVQSGEVTKLYYDYYGFPEESYNLKYTLPGANSLSKRVTELLNKAGIANSVDNQRGYDHGVFIPMKMLFPQGEISTVQLSLVKGLDPATHIKIGEALAPLRDEGVFILGSGMSYHNMRGFGNPDSNKDSEPFHTYLRDGLVNKATSYADRKNVLENWKRAPKAKDCHPREEHLIPLHVIVGATKYDDVTDGKEEFFADVIGVKSAGYVFQ